MEARERGASDEEIMVMLRSDEVQQQVDRLGVVRRGVGRLGAVPLLRAKQHVDNARAVELGRAHERRVVVGGGAPVVDVGALLDQRVEHAHVPKRRRAHPRAAHQRPLHAARRRAARSD